MVIWEAIRLNTVGIKITYIKYLICIKQACSVAEAVSRISKIWFLFETSNKKFFLLSRSFLIYATILIVTRAEKTNPSFLCTLGITSLPVIATLFCFSRKQNLED